MELSRKVKVWDKDVEVDVYQKSKSVWVASGSYLGHNIETKGRSANAALGLWRDAAKYKGG